MEISPTPGRAPTIHSISLSVVVKKFLDMRVLEKQSFYVCWITLEGKVLVSNLLQMTGLQGNFTEMFRVISCGSKLFNSDSLEWYNCIIPTG